MGSLKDEDIKVIVTQDEKPLDENNCGKDTVVKDDESYILVCEPRYYDVVANPSFGEHVLRLIIESDNFAIYKFTISARARKRELITEM